MKYFGIKKSRNKRGVGLRGRCDIDAYTLSVAERYGVWGYVSGWVVVDRRDDMRWGAEKAIGEVVDGMGNKEKLSSRRGERGERGVEAEKTKKERRERERGGNIFYDVALALATSLFSPAADAGIAASGSETTGFLIL
jgi:hypothetical protein